MCLTASVWGGDTQLLFKRAEHVGGNEKRASRKLSLAALPLSVIHPRILIRMAFQSLTLITLLFRQRLPPLWSSLNSQSKWVSRQKVPQRFQVSAEASLGISANTAEAQTLRSTFQIFLLCSAFPMVAGLAFLDNFTAILLSQKTPRPATRANSF